MTDLSLPKTTVNIVGANTVVPNQAQRILLVGQKLPAGSAVAGELLQNLSLNDENNQFGAGSMLAKMSRGIRSVNQITPVDVITLADDGGAAQAEGTITVAGALSVVGDSISIFIAGVEYSVEIDVSLATVTAVADDLVALITADSDSLVTAANVAGVITITAKNSGTIGNSISLEVDDNDASTGYTLEVTAAMASGATDPDLSNIFDLVGSTRYQTIIWPYGSQPDIDELVTFLNNRFNVTNQILDGVGITALVDEAANAATVAGVLNSQSIVVIMDEDISDADYTGPASDSYLPFRISIFGGIRALRLTDGASISRFVISSFGARDSFGGPALASKPYFNTPIPGVSPIKSGRGYSQTEIELINNNGASVMGNNMSGNEIVMGQAVTTYLTDSAGNPDISFKFLNYVDTASQAREYFSNNLRSRFSQSRLTTGDVIRGRDQANEETIAAYAEKLYQDLSGPEFVLVQAGETSIKFFKDNLEVVINTVIGRATITMIVPIVTQLREILATIQIAFGTEE